MTDPVEFRQVSPFGLVSPCERFRIGKYILNGKASYAAWDGFNCIGRYPSANDAKRACNDRQKETDRLEALSA